MEELDYKDLVINTLTPQEAVEILRSMGMRIGVETLVDGIDQGKIPIGVCIKARGGKNKYLIYQKKFDEYILANAKRRGA